MAVTKYLDKTGLTYFWNKIKVWCNSLFALDSAVVHKTGNEGISGTKTFNSQIVGTIGKTVGNGGFADMVQTFQSDNENKRSCTIRCTNGDGFNEILIGAHNESNGAPAGLYIRNTDGVLTGEFAGSLRLTRTVDASGTQDKSPALSIGSTLGAHLELDPNEIMAKADGTTTEALFLNRDGGDVYIGGSSVDYKSVTGRGKGSSTVPVYTNVDGIVTACGSSLDVSITGNAATATKLATPRTINGVSFDGSADITVADSTKVAKSGDTMNGDLTISKASPHLITKNTSITRGTAPSSDVTVTEILGRDSAEKSTWALYHTYATDRTHRIRLLCYNGLTTDNQYAEIGVGYDSDGNPYTNAPTPAEGDNSTKIATTAFVKTKCDGYLPLSGGTLTGALNGRASNVNLSIEPSSSKEDWRFSITKNSADTVHTGNLLRLGVFQSANTKDYRAMLTVANPRAGNLPTQESIAGETDDADASTSNCWGGIGVAYDYSKNKAYPYCSTSTCDLSDSSPIYLATNYWVRHATGDFACNAASATKATKDGSGNTITDYYCTLSTSQTVTGNKTFSGKVEVQNGIAGINKDNVVESANNLCLLAEGDAGKKQFYSTTTTGSTKLTDIPSSVATTIESYTVRRLSTTDWAVNQILHNTSSNLYFRQGTSANGGTWSDWKTFAFTDSNITGNAATATKFAVPVTINDVSFDGSTNIVVADSTKVSKTGDESIGGVKTFTDDPAISNATPILTLKNTDNTSYGDIRFQSSDGTNKAVIRAQRDTGQFFIGNAYNKDLWNTGALLLFNNNGSFMLRAKNDTDSSSLSGSPSGSLTWSGVVPSVSDDSTKLATTEWVRDATGNFACNAATASAFNSSKDVTLTGAVTGTASSTGGWSISTTWRSCIVGRTDSSTLNPWYKVAARNLNGGSSTYGITFYIENINTTNKAFGVLRVSVATNSDKTINNSVTKFTWLINDGFAEEDFVLVCPASVEPTVELWTKVAVGYLRKRFVVISEGGANYTGILWTLFDTSTAGQSASITTEGTQVISLPSSLEQRVKALEEAMNL